MKNVDARAAESKETGSSYTPRPEVPRNKGGRAQAIVSKIIFKWKANVIPMARRGYVQKCYPTALTRLFFQFK